MVLHCFEMKDMGYADGIIRVRFDDIAVKSGYFVYKPTDFYLVVTESDSSYDIFVCNIASNKRIETREFYNMNQNSIFDFTQRYKKCEGTLYCTKCDPDFACQDEYKLNPDELPPLIINDGNLYMEEEI